VLSGDLFVDASLDIKLFHNEFMFDFVDDWLLASRNDATERFAMIRASNECDLGLCFADVMYRGNIIARYKNMFDIATIGCSTQP
jgi:hypothetical protein